MGDPRTDMDGRRSAFLSKGKEYERYRPRYPKTAIEWLVGREHLRVIDIGCGPGNLTVQLSALGHDVVGIDPSAAMLEAARSKHLAVVQGRAESLPIADSSADVVTAATAFHWFDADRAVPEIRRVLAPGGRIALLTNIRDESVPWITALSGIIGSETAMAVTLGGLEGMGAEFVGKLEGGGLFRSTEHRVFGHEQTLTESDLVGLVASRSYIGILPETEREEVLRQVAMLAREHPDLRGSETFVMPYKTHAFLSFAS